MTTLADTHGNELAAEHADALLRLQRIARAQSGFRLVLLEYNVPTYRDRIIGKLTEDGVHAEVLDAASLGDVIALEESLAEAASRGDAVHVVGLDAWLAGHQGRARLEGLNLHRERIAKLCPTLIMLWLPSIYTREVALHAPDLWEWRAAVLDFTTPQPPMLAAEAVEGIDVRDLQRRLEEIEHALDDQSLTARQRAVLLAEAGGVALGLMQPARAIDFLEEAARAYQQLGDERNELRSRQQLAGAMAMGGNMAAAMQLLRDTVLPGFEKLGDRRGYTAALGGMAAIARAQGQHAEARALYQQAIETAEAMNDWAAQLRAMEALASVLRDQARYAEARPLLDRALAIRERQLGPEHPGTAVILNNLATLLYEQGEYAEARPLLERALAIREQQLGPEHPHTATSLHHLGTLLRSQGGYAEARSLYDRALAIREQQLGPDHPDTADSLNSLAVLLQQQGMYLEARPLLERALAIRERQLGPDHPDTAESLNNLAILLRSRGAKAEARPLLERALAVYAAKLGPDHPYTRRVRANLQSLPEP